MTENLNMHIEEDFIILGEIIVAAYDVVFS